MFKVEIQADNNTWFIADGGESLSPEAADELLQKLRIQGFRARAQFV